MVQWKNGNKIAKRKVVIRNDEPNTSTPILPITKPVHAPIPAHIPILNGGYEERQILRH